MVRSASTDDLPVDGTLFGEGLETASRAAAPPAGGTVLGGKYRLERVIGEGGMGSVWRAQHLQLDLPVAIKLLRSGNNHATLSARLKIEARAAAQLAHPAIVRVFDIDTTEAGDPFIVMELLDGESLSDLLDRGPLSGEQAVQLLLPIGEALILAHAKGIAHRDLKPHNIFIVREGDRVQPKLLDFGIAKLTSGAMPTGSLTDTGVLLGSPDYMSPEQARGSSDVDYRADIWQFCVVLYEAITTRTPFTGDNYNALMRAIVENEPEPLPLDDHTDARLAELIGSGLRKDREARPATLQILARDLAQWLLGRGVSEDACGSALRPKWPAQTAPRAAPAASSPLLSVSAETLVSAQFTPRQPAASAPRVRVSARGRVLAVAVGLLLVASVAWLLTRGATEQRTTERASTAATLVAERAGSAEIAATPPAPLELTSPATSPRASAGAALGEVNLASPSSSHSAPRSAMPRDGRPLSDAQKPPPVVRPTRDVRDETRELLQAY